MPRRSGRSWWHQASTGELLDARLCDLELSLEGTWVEEMTEKVFEELARHRLKLRPHTWLADEWLSPDGIPGIGIPFYLAHPRLVRLERQMMVEAEGAKRRDCLMLIRHELGHTVQHAYHLERRKRWRELFGKASAPYPDSYRPNPASKRYVQHLGGWYAQAHPAEDFAETFAVWLTPRSAWRKRYEGWPALKKLEYVDELMHELADRKPSVKSRARPFAIKNNRNTLRKHYEDKRERFSVGYSDAYDRDLERLFDSEQGEKASAMLRRHRAEIRRIVSRWTGEYTFAVDHLLREMIGRCGELGLRSCGSTEERYEFAVLLTTHAMTYVFRRREWHSV